MQNIESETGYDTLRWSPDGAFARVSQTAVYDTCGSATPASRRRTAPSRWKLARHGRTLVHLINIMQDLSARGVGRRVLTGQGAQIDTSAR